MELTVITLESQVFKSLTTKLKLDLVDNLSITDITLVLDKQDVSENVQTKQNCYVKCF
jgi:hypothetical protein